MLVFIILMLINSFFIKDEPYKKNKFSYKEFKNYIKNKPIFNKVSIIRILEGLTYSSSALNVIMTLYTITYIENNTHYGIFNSVLSFISLITTTIYAYKNSHKEKNIIIITNVLTILSLIYLLINPSVYSLILYLTIYNIVITYVILISKNKVVNLTNEYHKIKNEFKAEYHLYIEFNLFKGRLISYLIFLFIGLLNNIFYFKILIIIGIISYFILLYILREINE